MAKAATTTKPGAVAKISESANMPAFMRDDTGMGTENIGQRDMEVARIKLMQGLSPELQEYNDLRPGYFFHTAMGLNLGETLRVVPLYMDMRYILWRPRDMGGGILARADDGIHWQPADRTFEVKLDKKDGGATVSWSTARTVAASGLAEWGSMNPDDDESPPAATLMYNYVVAFPDHPDWVPAVMSLQRKAVRIAKKLNGKLKIGGAPLFGRILEVKSVDDKNAVGQMFKNYQILPAGFVTDQNQYEQYRQMHESFKSAGLNIRDLEDAQDDVVDTDEPKDDGKKKY